MEKERKKKERKKRKKEENPPPPAFPPPPHTHTHTDTRARTDTHACLPTLFPSHPLFPSSGHHLAEFCRQDASFFGLKRAIDRRAVQLGHISADPSRCSVTCRWKTHAGYCAYFDHPSSSNTNGPESEPLVQVVSLVGGECVFDTVEMNCLWMANHSPPLCRRGGVWCGQAVWEMYSAFQTATKRQKVLQYFCLRNVMDLVGA